MNVESLMSRNLRSCLPDHTLDCAAGIMWQEDCGVVPIVDHARHVVGLVTDRDLCMAAYTQNKRLSEILISSIGMKPVASIRPHESVEAAEKIMEKHQVRRLAVVDAENCLVGILSLGDLARLSSRDPHFLSSDGIARTLAAISRPRTGVAARANA